MGRFTTVTGRSLRLWELVEAIFRVAKVGDECMSGGYRFIAPSYTRRSDPFMKKEPTVKESHHSDLEILTSSSISAEVSSYVFQATMSQENEAPEMMDAATG